MIAFPKFLHKYPCLLVIVTTSFLILGGCDNSKVKYASNLRINVINELPSTVSDARMVNEDEKEIGFGYLISNGHKYIQSPFTFPITEEWTFHWKEGDEQYSSTFLIGPAIRVCR